MKNILKIALIALLISILLTIFTYNIYRNTNNEPCLIEDCTTTRSYGYPLIVNEVSRGEGLNCGTFDEPKREDICEAVNNQNIDALIGNFIFYYLISFTVVYFVSFVIRKASN